MSTELPDMIELETGPEPQHCVIWLHGLGADGNDFVPLVPELKLPAQLPLRFLFPHAPVRPITVNGGMAMRGWYDIVSLELDRAGQDPQGVRDSVAAVLRIIERENARGIATENILLAGFSQGGAIALTAAMTEDLPLAGVVGLSTYIPLSDSRDFTQSRHELPIFLAHGTQDDIVLPAYATATRELLLSAGFKPSWQTYPMGHALCAEEIAALSAWMQSLAAFSAASD
ncbi:alpha/beta hydrolase fold domain-containing protein [Granulosicoccaceae sp. 1_MG-2023]|nr:alpha/beta hydrolase fold domain-containing protein [Granulosicoccaceae sp. 1_MG-2023]